MQDGKYLKVWIMLISLGLRAGQGYAEETSSKLDRLEQYLMDQQALWGKERDTLRQEFQAQLAEQRTQLMDQHGRLMEQRAQLVDQHGQLMEQRARLADQHGQLVEQRVQLIELQSQLMEQRAQSDHDRQMWQQERDLLKQNNQAQWEKERDILTDDFQTPLMDQQTRCELDRQHRQTERDILRQEIQDLRDAVNAHEQQSRSSDHAAHDQRTETPVHTQRARSDDGGPLEVVVNRLAQDLTQLSGNVQAVSGNVQTLSGNLQALKTSVAGKGSTFVRWGSSTCSSSSQLVYAGVLGGSYWNSKGAAATTLCLTMSPTLRDFPSGDNFFASLYGGEYETFVDSHMNEDPVCALCWSPLSSSVMIPGTTECPGNWTIQYSGFLMAGFHDHPSASEFICVDTKREGRPASTADQGGRLLYYTKTVCGSLPCHPYENDKLVTCVVCSK